MRGRGIEETTARAQTTLAGDLYIHVFMVRYDHAQTFSFSYTYDYVTISCRDCDLDGVADAYISKSAVAVSSSISISIASGHVSGMITDGLGQVGAWDSRPMLDGLIV